MTALGRWSCGISSPYWTEMSRARAAYSAAERPASSPELDPGETPERAGAPRLVPLAPLFVLALEQGAGLVPLRSGRERVHDGQSRLPHEQLATDSAREVADPRRKILRCFRFAGEPTEDGLHRAGLSSQRSSSSSSASSSAPRAWSNPGLELAHASRQWMTRLKRRTRSRLAQGFLEQRDGTTVALELGKEDESLGAQGASSYLREEIGEDTFARASTRPRCAERAPQRALDDAGRVGVRRRQPKRVLGELGGGDRRPAGAGEGRGVLESSGDRGVRALRRKREVAGAVEGIRDDRRRGVRVRAVARPRTRRGRPPTRAAGA